MPLSDEGKRGLLYWNEIQASVSQRASTAEVWTAIREAAAREGLDSPGISLQAVNELRSYGAQIRNAGERLMGEPAQNGLTGSHIAEAPWSRPMDERAASPMLQVRFELQMIRDGQLVSEWKTLVHSGRTPTTIADLQRIIERAGMSLAASYDSDYAGYGDISALEI